MSQLELHLVKEVDPYHDSMIVSIEPNTPAASVAPGDLFKPATDGQHHNQKAC